MLGPREWHAAKHWGAPFEECFRCARQRSVCRAKIRLADWLEADEWVTEFHESRGYAPPWLYRYPCRWCPGYHTATIQGEDRAARARRARVEKQRRKWLARKVNSG